MAALLGKTVVGVAFRKLAEVLRRKSLRIPAIRMHEPAVRALAIPAEVTDLFLLNGFNLFLPWNVLLGCHQILLAFFVGLTALLLFGKFPQEKDLVTVF